MERVRESAKFVSKVWYFFVPLLLVAVVACNGFRVNSNKLSTIDYDKYDTYAWLPVPDSVGTLTAEEQANLVTAVNKEMQSRGYRLEVKNPDLLILAHRNFNKKQYYDTDPLYSSYSYYTPGFYTGPMYPYYYTDFSTIPYVTGYDIDQVDYTAGKLIIDIIDTDKKQIIWRGWATDQNNQKDLPLKLSTYVDEIYDEYPVEQNS